MAVYKIKTDKLPPEEAYAVEITKVVPIEGPKLNNYPNFTEIIHLILCITIVAFWEITRKNCNDMLTRNECAEKECNATGVTLVIFIAVGGFYIVDYYSGFDQEPGDPNERCLYIPRLILYASAGILFLVRNEAYYGCREWDITYGILSILYAILSLKHFWLSTFYGIIIAKPPPINPYPKKERVRRKKFRGRGQSRYVVPTGMPKI